MTNSNSAQTKQYKRATSGMSRFDVSCTNYHTTGFMCNRPILFRELAPKQHLHYVVDAFTRTSPTLQPMFGHFDARLTAFFVPYAMIWTKFNEFIEQTLRNGQHVNSVPIVTNTDLLTQFAVLCYNEYPHATDCQRLSSGATPPTGTFDFTLKTPTYDYYINFYCQGIRNVISSLEGLGYVLPRNADITGGTNFTAENWSALPLLCWCKVWYDFFKVQNVDSFPFEPDQATTLSGAHVYAMLGRMAYTPISYPKSYLANSETADAAGQTNYHSNISGRPTLKPSDSRSDATSFDKIQKGQLYNQTNQLAHASLDNSSTTTVGDKQQSTNTYGYADAQTPSGGTPHLNGTTRITDLALSQLGRMTDYVKRISVAGFNSMKRFLAEYGIEIDETSVLKTAEFLGDYTFTINLNEVTATDGANLGAQTGASLKGSSRFVIDYTAKEFGGLLVYLNIRPKCEYVRQRPRWITQHIKPLDFFKPDFDGFGYQGTRRDEMHVDTRSTYSAGSWNNADDSNVLGVVPVYGEYKTAYSAVTGDFARYNCRSTMNPYHTATLVDESLRFTSLCSRDLLFTNSLISKPENYLRIFGGTVYDPFLCHIDFNGYIDAPMRPLFDLPGDWSCDGPSGRMNGDERGHL